MTIKSNRAIAYPLLSLGFAVLIITVCFFAHKADAAWNWDTVKDFKTYNYRGLACNDNGLYVAVGDDGIIKTSTDLTNWNIRESGTTEYLWGCAWGNGRFVAAGSKGTMVYSRDGIEWTTVLLDQDIYFYDITWGKGKFLAVGCSYEVLNGSNQLRYIYSSPDGVTWVKELEYIDFCAWNNIKFTNDTFFVYGSEDYAFSSDGSNWKHVNLGEIGAMNDIIWDGRQYVRIATEYISSTDTSEFSLYKTCGIYTSPDAINWTPVEINLREDLFLGKITIFKDKYYMIVSDEEANLIIYSENLSEWSLASDTAYSEITGISSSNDKLVCVGWHETVLSSSNGRHWDFEQKFSPHLLKVLWNGSHFLAIGNDGTIVISVDGIHWTQYNTIIEHTLVDAVWTGSEYLALSVEYDHSSYNILHSEIYKSTDGINWTYLSSINEKNMEELYYFNGTAFVLGRDGQIMISKDAINWSRAETGTDTWLRGLAWNGSQYVCVGLFGALLTSNDGISWVNHKPITTADLNCVIWNGLKFAAVGGWNRIASSEDGVNWFLKFESKDYTYVDAIWDGSRFVFLHNMGEVVISEDAKNFTKVSTDSLSGPNSIAWNGEKYVMVGNSGTICTFIPRDIIKVKINDFPVVFDVAPQIINGRTMIPARAVLEKLGADLTWNAQNNTIHVNKDDIEILLTIGSSLACVNGQEAALDSPAVIIDNRTLVPLRFLAESLESEVSWDQNSRTVLIN